MYSSNYGGSSASTADLYSNYSLDTTPAALQRILDKSFSSPFIKDQLREPGYGFKIEKAFCVQFANAINALRDDVVQRHQSEYPIELIDSSICRHLQASFPRMHQHLRELAQPLYSYIQNKLNDYIGTVAKNFQKHQNRDKALKELQMLIENPKYDSLEKKTDKVFGKFTSFINKVTKEQVFKETDSSQKAPEPTLKQKMVQKFCIKFEEKFKSAYGVGQVRQCMFNKDIEDVQNLVDEIINDSLRRIQTWTPKVSGDTYWTPYSSTKYGTFTATKQEIQITQGNLKAMPQTVTQQQTSHVMTSNPYLSQSQPASNPAKIQNTYQEESKHQPQYQQLQQYDAPKQEKTHDPVFYESQTIQDYKQKLRQTLATGYLNILKYCNSNWLYESLFTFYRDKFGSLEFREFVFKKYLLMLFPLTQDQYQEISGSIEKFLQIYYYDQWFSNYEYVNQMIQKYTSTFSDAQNRSINEITYVLNQQETVEMGQGEELDNNLFLLYCIHSKVIQVITSNDTNYLQVFRTKNDPGFHSLFQRFLQKLFFAKTKAITYLSLFEQEIAKHQVETIPQSGDYNDMDPMRICVPSGNVHITESLKSIIQNVDSDPKYFKSIEFLCQPNIPSVKLQQLYLPTEKVHKHMMIAVSGFLSEDSDQNEDWKHLKVYCAFHEIPLFAVQWQAQSTQQVNLIAQNGLSNLKNNLKVNNNAMGVPDFSMQSLLNAENVKASAQTVKQGVTDTMTLFNKARNNAKLTGKVLGHFLAQNTLFDSQSISLIGFSLGSQVIKSCLNTIEKLDLQSQSPIKNIYFLGGATYIKQQSQQKQKTVFQKVVNGRMCNVFTENDTTLQGFQTMFSQTPIGRKTIYNTDENNRVAQRSYDQLSILPTKGTFSMENHDISTFCKGHLQYRGCLDQILEKVDFDF